MRTCRFVQHVSCPLIDTFPAHLGSLSNSSMNLWRDAKHQLARIWFLGLLAYFFACFQIVIYSFFKCCPQFAYSFTVKANNVVNASYMTNKASIFVTVLNAGTIPFVERRKNARLILSENGISLDEVEKDLIKQALALAGNNQTKAAKLLNISYDTLRYKVKTFDLK
jgi:hypothetical protein